MSNKNFTLEKQSFGFTNVKRNFKRPYSERKVKDNIVKQQQDLISFVKTLFFED